MKKRNTPKEMGQKIQLARKEAGYTQDELAELLDINPKNLSAVERGALGLSIERLCTISMALHVSVDSLLFHRKILMQAIVHVLQQNWKICLKIN